MKSDKKYITHNNSKKLQPRRIRNFAAASQTRTGAGSEMQTAMDGGLAAKAAWRCEAGRRTPEGESCISH